MKKHDFLTIADAVRDLPDDAEIGIFDLQTNIQARAMSLQPEKDGLQKRFMLVPENATNYNLVDQFDSPLYLLQFDEPLKRPYPKYKPLSEFPPKACDVLIRVLSTAGTYYVAGSFKHKMFMSQNGLIGVEIPFDAILETYARAIKIMPREAAAALCQTAKAEWVAIGHDGLPISTNC